MHPSYGKKYNRFILKLKYNFNNLRFTFKKYVYELVLFIFLYFHNSRTIIFNVACSIKSFLQNIKGKNLMVVTIP